MVPGGVYALIAVWGPLGGGEGEGGKLKAAPNYHSLDALGGWRINTYKFHNIFQFWGSRSRGQSSVCSITPTAKGSASSLL